MGESSACCDDPVGFIAGGWWASRFQLIVALVALPLIYEFEFSVADEWEQSFKKEFLLKSFWGHHPVRPTLGTAVWLFDDGDLTGLSPEERVTSIEFGNVRSKLNSLSNFKNQTVYQSWKNICSRFSCYLFLLIRTSYENRYGKNPKFLVIQVACVSSVLKLRWMLMVLSRPHGIRKPKCSMGVQQSKNLRAKIHEIVASRRSPTLKKRQSKDEVAQSAFLLPAVSRSQSQQCERREVSPAR